MSGAIPEERVRTPVLLQRWCEVLFVHWEVEPTQLRSLLPSELELDLVDGRAWVGLTPMQMDDVRPPFVPVIPGLSHFPETNVRTYVRTAGGAEGLRFLDLEVASWPTAVGGRLFYGVPYHRASMSIERHDGEVRYLSRRSTGTGTVGHDIRVRPGGAATGLPAWHHHLTGRWRSISRSGPALAAAAVQHERWPLHQAKVLDLEENLLAALGLYPTGAPVVHWSPGVSVRLGPPRPVAARSGGPAATVPGRPTGP